MVVVGEVGRSAVYMRYNNGPRTLPWGTPAWTGDRVWCIETILTKNAGYANMIGEVENI
jgi:hypothetical protein